MGKIAEIRNEEKCRTFDLVRETDALYIDVKCSDNGRHSKILRIKVSDVLYQIWGVMTSVEKRKACKMIKDLVSNDQKIA